MQVKDITDYLEQWAPLAYQESYDNAGLLVGSPLTEVIGVLLCLDVTEGVLEEAKQLNCNLIIAHHPLIFQPIKKLTGANAVEKCIIKAIQQGMAVYVLHTNLDNILSGINQKMAQRLGLINCKILLPKSHTLQKLAIQCTSTQRGHILEKLRQVVPSSLVDDRYAFFSSGLTGTSAQGSASKLSSGASMPTGQLELLFPAYLGEFIIKAIKQYDPLGVNPYYMQPVESKDPHVGAGIIGELPHAMASQSFITYLKSAMELTGIRHTLPGQKSIRTVALCGGSGSFLRSEAIKQGADTLVTADVKYHDFLTVEERLLLVDIGHYESEVAIKELIYNKLSEKFSNIVLLKSTTQTNPVYYA